MTHLTVTERYAQTADDYQVGQAVRFIQGTWAGSVFYPATVVGKTANRIKITLTRRDGTAVVRYVVPANLEGVNR